MLLILVGAILLIYLNARLAARKGRNPYVWGLISLLAFFVFYALLGGIYLLSVFKGTIDPNLPQAQMQESVKNFLLSEPLTFMMMLMLGIGGMLVVRYILERAKPLGGPDMPV